jgi:hypothetical protein
MKTQVRKKHPPKPKPRKKIDAISANAIGKWQRNHPDTSRDAAIAIYGISGELRVRVFELLWDYPEGLTDQQIQHLLVMAVQTETPRRGELVKLGAVRNSRRKRKTTSGRWATVWEAIRP